ncbi:DNA methyltransferase [Kaistella polysaccharea]|uniref:DNA methyltransferase n=1 Tax=Kaistella polysaccharea TaxID=2878534 RepID=UPI001CF50863|nr:DNA methyltransferase [Kaistella polysaccharea]
MRTQKIKADVVFALQTRKVSKISTNLIEIPEEWYQLNVESSKLDFRGELKTSIQKTKSCTPINVFERNGKYVITDGVSRFIVLQDLGLNQIDCYILNIKPQSSNEIKDLIIESQLRSQLSSEGIKKYIVHYLRIGVDHNFSNSTLNERVNYLAEILPRGWGRSNIFQFKSLLEWELQNPSNPFNMSEKILDENHSMTVNKSIDVRCYFDNQFNQYTMEKEVESRIIQKYVDGEIRLKKEVDNLIDAYLHKAENRADLINVPPIMTADRYLIMYSDSSKVKFPKNTIIDGIFTSPPYFNQIRYSKIGDPEYANELGWEATPEEYVKKIVDTILLGAEVMDDKGVIMININETYIKGECMGIIALYITEMKKHFHFIQSCMWVKEDGKPNGENVKRLMNNCEHILIFSKTRKYNFNKFKLLNPDKYARITKGCSEQKKSKDPKTIGLKQTSGYHISNPFDQCKEFTFENDFMNYLVLNQRTGRSQDENLKTSFFGSFPTLLPIPFIMSFVPENGTVWDPFGGTGTTGRTVLSLNRKVIITELLAKNIPNIKMMLETGISEFNADNYEQMKKDSSYLEGMVDMAA